MTRACTSSKTVVILALVGDVLVAATKIGAATVTGSSAASLLIGLMLAGIAAILARESKSLLIGERAAPDLVAAAVKLAREEPGVASAQGAITIHLAPDQILVALSIEFDDRQTTTDIEASVARIEERTHAAHPEIVTLFIKPQTRERFAAWRLSRFGAVDPASP